MSPSRYQHIIWDWNGTLMDDAWLCVEVLNQLLQRRSLPPVSMEFYRREFGFPVVNYYRKLGFDFEKDSFEKVSHEFIETYNRRRLECSLYPGVNEVLRLLKERGVTHSVLSAYRHDTLQEIVRHYELDSHFMGINGLGDIYANSKVELGLGWIKQLPFDPSEILLVGDTEHDYEVAQAIGVSCVLLDHGHHESTRLRSLTDRVLSDIHSLHRWVLDTIGG
jgi:phosphoglycolate phosphatase